MLILATTDLLLVTTDNQHYRTNAVPLLSVETRYERVCIYIYIYIYIYIFIYLFIYIVTQLAFCDVIASYCLVSACYGIVTVPTGAWFCRKCESQERAARVVSTLTVFKQTFYIVISYSSNEY